MSDATKITLIHCNRCGHETKHEIVMERRTEGSEIVDQYHGIEVSWSTTHSMLECRGCADVSMKKSTWCSENEPGEVDDLFYPPRVSRRRPAWLDELPDDYTALLDEIYSALHADSRSLAMMGLRAVIDLFISRTLGDTPAFKEGMNALVSQNYITTRSREVIDAAVEAGHAASHRGHKPTRRQLNAVMDIVEHLTQYDLLAASADSLIKTTPKRPPRKSKAVTDKTSK